MALPRGIEPRSFRLEGGRLIHWTTEAIGHAGENRTPLSGFADRTVANPAPREIGTHSGNRTPIIWFRASRPAIERSG